MSFSTSIYKLHYYETPTSLRFVMLTDPTAGSMRNALRGLYAGPYIEHVVRNPGPSAVCVRSTLTLQLSRAWMPTSAAAASIVTDSAALSRPSPAIWHELSPILCKCTSLSRDRREIAVGDSAIEVVAAPYLAAHAVTLTASKKPRRHTPVPAHPVRAMFGYERIGLAIVPPVVDLDAIAAYYGRTRCADELWVAAQPPQRAALRPCRLRAPTVRLPRTHASRPWPRSASSTSAGT